MAPATPHSFRHILLTRILLMLMPLLGLGEWLVLQQARLSLLENAQQQTQEIAKSQAISLELQQLETAASACHGKEGHDTEPPPTIIPGLPCHTSSSIDKSLTNPSPQNSGNTAPVVAVFSSANNLLKHSLQRQSPQTAIAPQKKAACRELEKSSHCSLISLLQSPDFQPSQFQNGDKPQLILNDQWMIASYPVRLGNFSNPPNAALPPSGTPSVSDPSSTGHLVVALPTSQILAPLTRLSLWMLGITVALMGLATVITLYLSRQLARPTEQLRDRLLAVQQQLTTANLQGPAAQLPDQWGTAQSADSPFKIHEFQQLASTFDQLVQCLNQRSSALEQATQEAYATSKLKSDFIAATSHELRTPLNAIIGHIQLIQDGYCDDAAEEKLCLNQVNNAALHLLKVLNELLDIARIEAGKFEFEQQEFELGQLLEEVLEMERSHFIQKGLTLQTRATSTNPAKASYWVQADRDKLKQVLLNVINNALKFTDQGSIHVSLQPLCELESSDTSSAPTVVLSVTDTGIGIDQRQRQQLFRPFARAKPQGRAPYEGSGLGLAISRTLMERMGGEIRLYSPGLGEGTTVELHLPLQAHPVPCSPKLQKQTRNFEATSET